VTESCASRNLIFLSNHHLPPKNMSSTSKEEGVKLLFGCIPSGRLRFPKLPFKRKRTQPQEPLELEKHARDEQAALKDELDEERAKFARFKAEAAGEKRDLEDQIRQLKELMEAQVKEIGLKDADIQRLRMDGDTMRAKVSRIEKGNRSQQLTRFVIFHTQLTELRAAEKRAEELSTRLADTEKLLTDRTTELSAAQVFLTKVDDVSEAEVVGMIDNLNTLIVSASGALSDAWDQREPIPGTLVDESDLEQLRNDFGILMAEQIAARNTVAVNLAAQMHLCRFIARITSGWGPAGGNIATIYGMISTKGK
jgi:hypothetical protein